MCFRNKLAHRKSQPILEHKGDDSVVHIQQRDWLMYRLHGYVQMIRDALDL